MMNSPLFLYLNENAELGNQEAEEILYMPNTEGVPPIPKSSNRKWIFLGMGIIALVVLILIISFGGKKKDSPANPNHSIELSADNTEADADIEYLLNNPSEVSAEDSFNLLNPWHISYLHNEWGEEDTSYPFLSTVLQGTAWNINLDYMPPTLHNPNGSFRLFLLDRNGNDTNMFGPVNILVRGSDGETKSVEVTGVQNSVAFIEDPSTVEGLKLYLDQDSFDIRIEFEKWNERHATRARWESTPGFFEKAIETML